MPTCRHFLIYFVSDEARGKIEDEVGIKMIQMEWDFLEDMQTTRLMFCEDFVDHQWQKSQQRQMQTQEHMMWLLAAKQKHEDFQNTVVWDEVNLSKDSMDTDDVTGTDNYEPEVEEPQKISRPCTSNTKPSTSESEAMPPEFCHVRESAWKVRPEFYKVKDILNSQFHCSSNQAVAAVIEVANGMFWCSWKYHDQDYVIDIDTASHIKNIWESGKAIGALTLACRWNDEVRWCCGYLSQWWIEETRSRWIFGSRHDNQRKLLTFSHPTRS